MPLRPPTADDQALQRAAFALQSNRPAEAARIAGELLKKNPGDPRAAQIFGYSLTIQGRGQEAIVPLERATQQSRDPALETQLAMALRQAGRSEDAVSRFQIAIGHVPPFPPAFLEFGNLLAELGRHDEAINVLKRGLAVAPMFAELSMQLGRCFTACAEDANAVAAFTRALDLEPRNTHAMFGLARALQNAGDYARAAETFRRLLAIEPDDTASRIGLGICLTELGRGEEGLDNLRRAATASPKMYGEVLGALVFCGHGRFWLDPRSAARALKGEKS
jgi:tetratricopeptide (TPR) repeat protein